MTTFKAKNVKEISKGAKNNQNGPSTVNISEILTKLKKITNVRKTQNFRNKWSSLGQYSL